jgi:hypothetical protein
VRLRDSFRFNMAGLYPSTSPHLPEIPFSLPPLSLFLQLSLYTSLPLYSRFLARYYRDLISTQPIPRLEPRYDRQPNAARGFPWETELSSNEDILRLRKEIFSEWRKNVKLTFCIRMIKTESSPTLLQSHTFSIFLYTYRYFERDGMEIGFEKGN